MRRRTRVQAGGSVLAAAAVAEGARRILTPRSPVRSPAAIDVRDYFSAEELERGRRFARPQLWLGLMSELVELAALVAVVARPPALLRRRWGSAAGGGAAVAAGMSLALAVPGLPGRALARRRRIAVGLDTQSWTGWASDLLKASAIQTAFSAAAGAGVIAATRRFHRWWWIPVGAGAVGVGGLLAALAPVVLDPIFNDFEPLPEGQTREDVLALARDAGVTVGEVYSIDASRRTTAANAYVTGLGPTKRVVLFDTMLDRYGRDEVRLVVAHELGHVAHRDVPRNVAFAALVAPAVAFAVQQCAEALAAGGAGRAGGSDGSGAPAPGALAPGALPALALAATVVAAPLGPIAARLSRAVERRADQFSLELAGAPEAFISFERGIAVQNVADLQPPRWQTALMASHPPTAERIGAAVAFQRSSG